MPAFWITSVQRLMSASSSFWISIERSGVNGTMTVTADSFDVNIKLGLMMKAFKPMIEAELAKNVSRMVEKGSASQA